MQVRVVIDQPWDVKADVLVVPVLGPLVAIPLQAALLPWMKRRRLRKFVRDTTPRKP